MIPVLAHAALSLALTLPNATTHHRLPDVPMIDMAAVKQIVATVKPERERISSSRGQNPDRLSWLPWAGAAAGATLVGIGVADEEDLVLSGKLMWIGIGAAAGAGAGWLIAKLAR